VSFDGSTSSDPGGSITSYAWNFGNGGTATGAQVQAVYSTAGSYVVTLTVTDNLGATAQTTQTVVVSATPGTSPPAPVLRLSAGSLSGLANNDAVASWSDPATGRVATAPSSEARAIYRTGQTPAGGAAVHFQGDDYYEVPDEAALELEQSSTLVAVVAWDVVDVDQGLISKHSDNTAPGAYFAALNASGQLLVDRPWLQSGPRATSGITAGAFRLVVIRVSASQVDFRIDRAAAGTATLGPGVAGNNPLRVGVLRHTWGSSLQFFLRGRIAELRVYNTGLADAHLQALETELYDAHLKIP
jgi:PKD repeat protein